MNGTEIPIGEAVGLAVAARAALDRGDLAAALLREHAGAGSADLANVLVLQADAERLAGELAAAEGSARAAAAIMSRWPAGPQGELDRIRVQAALALGMVLVARGEYAAAGQCLRAALDEACRVLGPRDLDTAGVLNGLGLVGKYTGDFAAAAG